jgi:hypothetical protein
MGIVAVKKVYIKRVSSENESDKIYAKVVGGEFDGLTIVAVGRYPEYRIRDEVTQLDWFTTSLELREPEYRLSVYFTTRLEWLGEENL